MGGYCCRIDRYQQSQFRSASTAARTLGRNIPLPPEKPKSESFIYRTKNRTEKLKDISIFDFLQIDLSRSWQPWLGFSVTGFLFGGLHLLAWTVPLPTQLQVMLWKTSALLVMCAGPLFALFSLAFYLLPALLECMEACSGGEDSTLWKCLLHPLHLMVRVCFLILYTICLLAYVAARVYLVVAVFISMAYLPPSALETPRWSKYLWHLFG